MEEGDLVLFEQVQDAIVVLLHNGVFAANHFGHIHLQAFHGDAMVSKVVRGLIVVLRRLQQSLGGNAAHVGAGATGRGATLGVFPFVDTGHLETQLGGTNGSDVATRAPADDDDVELIGHDVCWLGRRSLVRYEDPQQDVEQEAKAPEQEEQRKDQTPDPGLDRRQPGNAPANATQPSVFTRPTQTVH